MRKTRTFEEKAAKTIADVVKDITLDLDQIGKYIARHEATVVYNRFQVVSESAMYEKEKINGE